MPDWHVTLACAGSQIALTAPSDFVWLVDDDMIPGKKYLAQLMHAAGTELLGTALLGSIGRVLPRPGRDMSLVSYRKVRGARRQPLGRWRVGVLVLRCHTRGVHWRDTPLASITCYFST